ncbi:MAG: condensation domain-containing protein, partial [Chthoniobacterales bacterium]
MTASNPAHELWWRSTGLQRAMILASLNPDSLGAYHQQFVVHLDPEIDGTTWLRAAQMFLQQHGGLMARFQMRADALFTARSETPAPLGPTIDLRDEPGSPTEQLHDFLERDRARPFAILDDAPVWRSALLSLGKGERAWVWSHHHALCDNFVAPLLRGIFGVYDRLLAGAVVESEPASPDFYDYLR